MALTQVGWSPCLSCSPVQVAPAPLGVLAQRTLWLTGPSVVWEPGSPTTGVTLVALGSLLGLSAAARRAGERGRRGMPLAVLPDGTNEEGEDLTHPLDLKLQDAKGVVLYGNAFSPPCRKIQTMLNFYEVPFSFVTGRHPTSDYKKIPVLEVNGRQVNDSHIIVKNLVPVLTGKPLTAAQLDWERRITFEFQPAIEVDLFSNGADFARMAGLDDWRGGAIQLLSPLLGLLIGAVFRSRYGDFPTSATFGKKFREACGEQPFFHGDAPGPVDLSLFGTYRDMASKGASVADAFLDSSGLRAWHERMVDATRP